MNLQGKSVKQNAAYYMAGQAGMIIFGFTLNVIIARLLPKESFGTYTYLLALAATFLPFLNFGLHGLYAVRGSRDRDRIGAFWIRSLLIKAGLTPFVVAGFCIAFVLLEGEASTLMVWLALYLVLQSLLIGTDIVFKPAEEGRMWAIRRVVYEGSLIVMFLIATLAFNVRSAAPLVVLAAIATGLGVIWATASSWRLTNLSLASVKQELQDFQLFQELKPLFPFTMLAFFWVFYYRTNAILLQKLSTSEELADYRIGFLMVTLALYLPGAVTRSSVPRLALYHHEKRYDEYHALFAKAFDLVAYGSIFVTSMGAIFGGEAIVFVFGEKYSTATTPWLILCGAMGFLFIQALFTALLSNIGKEILVAKMIGICFGLQAVVVAFLIPELGAKGAATGMLIASPLMFAISVQVLNREGAFAAISLRRVLSSLGVAAVTIAIAWIVRDHSIVMKAITLPILFLGATWMVDSTPPIMRSSVAAIMTRMLKGKP